MAKVEMLETEHLKITLLSDEIELCVGDTDSNPPVLFVGSVQLFNYINGLKFVKNLEFDLIRNFVNNNWKIYSNSVKVTNTNLTTARFSIDLYPGYIEFIPEKYPSSQFSETGLVLEYMDKYYTLEEIKIAKMFLYAHWNKTKGSSTKVMVKEVKNTNLTQDSKTLYESDKEFGSLTDVINKLANDLKPQFDKEVLSRVDLSKIYTRCLEMIPMGQDWEQAVISRSESISDELVETITDEITKEVVDKVDDTLDFGVIDNLKCEFYDNLEMKRYTIQEWADHLGITYEEAYEPNVKYVLENGTVVYDNGTQNQRCMKLKEDN